MDQQYQFQKQQLKDNIFLENIPSFQHQQPNKNMGKPASTIERELKQVIPKISEEQRFSLAQQLLKQLNTREVKTKTLQQTLSLSTTDPQQMSSEEISKVATYAYQYYPDIFQTVLTQPNLVQFLTNPILSAIVGIMAARWLDQ
jgi:ABC-type transport system involved in cytochrome bd biosynthesis fused ATPase/permease subunit